MQLVTHKDAKAQGLPRYFTGIPCGRGHIAERKTGKGDCIVCLKMRQVDWAKDNADQVNAASRGWYAANTEKAKIIRADWRSRNAEKDRADIAAYQATHKEEIKVAADLWVKNNPDKTKAKRNRYQERHHEEILASAAAWRRANRDKVNAKKQEREAQKRRAMPLWANRKAIQAIYREATRLTAETGIPHHVDHIVPLKSKIVSGLHWEGNLRVLPGSENQSKSNRFWPDMPDLLEAA